jgi:hypothetical protein
MAYLPLPNNMGIPPIVKEYYRTSLPCPVIPDFHSLMSNSFHHTSFCPTPSFSLH